MKFKTILVLSLIIVMLTSCKDIIKSSRDYPILKASLNEKQISIHDIFKNIQIIPLETTKESFFRYVEKLEVYNDTIYILDRSLNSLYIFSPNGNYINKIHRVGQGPGEYIMACDFLINPNNRIIEMLSPMGAIYKYQIDGTFVEQSDLPKPPMNYLHFELLDNNHHVTWSSVDDDSRGVSILSSDKYQLSNSYFPNSGLWGAFRLNTVFHKYKKAVYYHESMANKVYHISPEGYQTAYEWDLGTEIIDPKRLSAPLKTINETLMTLGNDFKEGRIPFCFAKQYQTDKYYYASLRFGLVTKKNLFYNKSTKESLLFEKTVEGIKIDPIFMTEDYTIGILEHEFKDALRGIVSADDVKLLDRMKEDDNIWLIKFIFK